MLFNAVPQTANSADPRAPEDKNIFKPVWSAPPAKRAEIAADVYISACRKMSAAAAMTSLDSLNRIAVQLDDKTLQCAVYWFRADYYSVNKLFNPLSIHYYQEGIDFAKKNMLLPTLSN